MTRVEQRNYRANKVAQEVRWQLANYGKIKVYGKLYDLVLSWKDVSLKKQLKRPTLK